MWALTFVGVDGDRVYALDCIGSQGTETRDRPVIDLVGSDLRIAGLKDHRPLSEGLLKFAAETGLTITMLP